MTKFNSYQLHGKWHGLLRNTWHGISEIGTMIVHFLRLSIGIRFSMFKNYIPMEFLSISENHRRMAI